MNTAQSTDEHLRKSKAAKEDATDGDDSALFFFKALYHASSDCHEMQSHA